MSLAGYTNLVKIRQGTRNDSSGVPQNWFCDHNTKNRNCNPSPSSVVISALKLAAGQNLLGIFWRKKSTF